MDLDLLGSLGWREGLILVIVLLVSYIVVIFLRMRRLQNELKVTAVPQSVAQSAVAAYTGVQDVDAPAAAGEPSAATNAGVAVASAADALPAPPVETDEVDFAWNEPPPEIPGQALIDALQDDVYQLRCEVDELRAGLASVRDDFRHQLACLLYTSDAADE